jgi:argininosuccinate lyase
MSKTKKSLWRGPLAGNMHPLAQAFLSSFAEDLALVDIDIDVTEAHALALGKAGLFDKKGLALVLKACEDARRKVQPLVAKGGQGEFHDIHPLVEKMIIDGAGEEAGGRIHLGKSRNDQVATDICIFARRGLLDILDEILSLVSELRRISSCEEGMAVVPAYTHVRPAQATTWGHLLMGHAGAFQRDAQRLFWTRVRFNSSPLGACAVAGTSVPVDRALTAKLLGFAGVWENSVDATSSRDVLVEALALLAILQGNLSRLAADIMMMAAPGERVLNYPDEWADTSSAMPQKKNPDPLELVRARAAESAGLAAAGMGIIHGLTSGYNRDLQELKPLLWNSMGLAGMSTAVVRNVVARVSVDRVGAREVLSRGYAAALDIAEWLTIRKGVPFRRAHHAVGLLVQKLSADGTRLEAADVADVSRVIAHAAGRPIAISGAEWRDASDPAKGAARRTAAGGPGALAPMLAATEKWLNWIGPEVREYRRKDDEAARLLGAEVRKALGRRA